jgi:hypothetical protein
MIAGPDHLVILVEELVVAVVATRTDDLGAGV